MLLTSRPSTGLFVLGCIVSLALTTASRAAELPPGPGDWLVDASDAYRSSIRDGEGGRGITLSNGLVRRSFRLRPGAATVALDNLRTGASLLRAVGPEARLVVDGAEIAVGGLVGQTDRAYLRPEWLDAMTPTPDALAFTGFASGEIRAPFAWKRVRHSEDRPWPPPGRALALRFETPASRASSAWVRFRSSRRRARRAPSSARAA